MTAPEAESPWFALVVKSNWEKRAASSLASNGYECLLPIYRQRRRWSDRWKELELPLFPGYLFCRFNPDERTPVLSAPGVLSIVGIRRTATPIDANEIAAVQLVERSGVPAQPWLFLEAGRMVRLDRGPLRGLTGVILQCKSEARLIVSVTLLKRSIAVEIDRGWVSELPPVPSIVQPDVSMPGRGTASSAHT